MAAPELKSLRSVLGGVVKALGLDDPTEGVLLANWAAVVGPDVAAACRVERLKQGRLFLQVEDAAWSYELSMRREALRERINSFLENDSITEVHVRVRSARGR